MKMLRKVLCLLLVLFLPSSCLGETVVTSFYPIWLLALNLTDGIGGLQVRNLAAPETGCLHDYQLQTGDMKLLSEADIFLINGAGMESFLPVVTGAYPDLPVIDATDGLPFISESDIVEIGEAEEGEAVNSHLWLDPQRAAGMAANLAEGLVKLLPDREQQILDNLEKFSERLRALDETIREETAGIDRKVIIFHEALPYFAEACGLTPAAIVNKEPEDSLAGDHRIHFYRSVFHASGPVRGRRADHDDHAVSDHPQRHRLERRLVYGGGPLQSLRTDRKCIAFHPVRLSAADAGEVRPTLVHHSSDGSPGFVGH